MKNPPSGILIILMTAALGGTASAAAPPASVTIEKSTRWALGSGSPDDADAMDVPNIPPGLAVRWDYIVTNTGSTVVPFANVVVTDDQSVDSLGFLSVLSGDADNQLEPGEQWIFRSSGTSLDLANPPANVGVVPNACTHGGTEPARTAYVNVGTVTIPEATDSDASFYCNPPPATVDLGVIGYRARLTDSDSAARRKNLFGLHDPAIDLTGLDPTITGITVTVGHVGGGPVVTFDLPASGWKRGLKSPVPDFRYRSKTGPVSSAWLRHGQFIRLTASGPDAYPLGQPQDEVGIIVDLDGVRFCSVFGGAISQNDARRFQARFAPPPDQCPSLGGF